jgi:hypothetical protein
LIIEEPRRQYSQMQSIPQLVQGQSMSQPIQRQPIQQLVQGQSMSQPIQRQSIPQLVQGQSMSQPIQSQPIQQILAQPTQYLERSQPVRTVSQPTQNTQFSNLIDTTPFEVNNAPQRNFPAVYEPFQTYEHDANIPYLHPIEIPQYIHDTKYVPVPQIQIVEKPVIQERIRTVAEKPTEMHHINLKKEIGPTLNLMEEEVEKGWPWWWWLPLLLLG